MIDRIWIDHLVFMGASQAGSQQKMYPFIGSIISTKQRAQLQNIVLRKICRLARIWRNQTIKFVFCTFLHKYFAKIPADSDLCYSFCTPTVRIKIGYFSNRLIITVYALTLYFLSYIFIGFLEWSVFRNLQRKYKFNKINQLW